MAESSVFPSYTQHSTILKLPPEIKNKKVLNYYEYYLDFNRISIVVWYYAHYIRIILVYLCIIVTHMATLISNITSVFILKYS